MALYCVFTVDVYILKSIGLLRVAPECADTVSSSLQTCQPFVNWWIRSVLPLHCSVMNREITFASVFFGLPQACILLHYNMSEMLIGPITYRIIVLSMLRHIVLLAALADHMWLIGDSWLLVIRPIAYFYWCNHTKTLLSRIVAVFFFIRNQNATWTVTW